MLPNHMKRKKRFSPGTGKFQLSDKAAPAILISDLHLTPESPETLAYFHDFLGSLGDIDSLYVLGDLFEYWLGDDAYKKLGHSPVEDALKGLTKMGTPVRIMPGNRDFLLDQEFAYRTGSTILKDATIQLFFGRQALLLHGDSLCTDDEAHQKFRLIVNQPEWRSAFLRKPISERDDIGRAIRFRSNIEKRYKTSRIMDVNQYAVEKALKPTEARLLIHGHTHRPSIHQWTLNEQTYSRVVLGDWSVGPSWIEIRGADLQLHYQGIVERLDLNQI
jgi:UDP-2,3-diacylglucosamine hydrolase